jgi:orotate phosphoribosyltransferase-like protein
MPRCKTSPARVKTLLDTITVCRLRSAGFSFAAIAKSLNPPVSKQYAHKLFWKAIGELNRQKRERAERWRHILEACKRMDRIDPGPGRG